MIRALLIAALALAAPGPEVVTQTACTSLEGKEVEAAKRELLLAARRDAVEKLLGTLVTSFSRAADLALQKDQIRAASAGYLRLAGEPAFFNGQALGELCVTIKAYTLDEDRAAIERAVRALAGSLRDEAPKLALEADLDLLGLGMRTVVRVTASPPQALDGARCDWTVEPADVLRAAAADGACRLELAMPDAPLAGRAATLPAHLAVRVRRGDQVLDELTVRGAVHNGIPVEAAVTGSVLKPGAAATVSIVRRGSPQPLPPGTTCSWSLADAPLVFTPTAENGCQGRLELKPEDLWTPKEGINYAATLLFQVPASIPVRLLHAGGLVHEGSTEVDLTYSDARDPQRLLERYEHLPVHGGSGTPGAAGTDAGMGGGGLLIRSGLPALSDLSEKSLELRLFFQNGSWSLATFFTGSPRVEGPLDNRHGLLRVLYSGDGKAFVPWLLAGGALTPELARLDHVWVEIQSAAGGEGAGPFRLPLDVAAAARGALEEAWQALNGEDKQSFVCGGLVAGGESFYGTLHHEFLAILDQVSVGRGDGGVWRTQRYGARLDHLFSEGFERVARPVGPTDFTARLRFASGAEEVYACRFRGHPPAGRADLHYVRLKRTAGEAAAPEEIEAYLEYRSPMGWTVSFGDGGVADAAYVRVSSGGGFKTVERTAAGNGTITFRRAEGKQLILRFVSAGGDEVEYRGDIDYAALEFASLRSALFSESKLECAAYDSAHLDEDEVDRRPRGLEGPAVVCGFAIGGHEYMPVASAIPVLRSVAYGCARDQLTLEDHFDDERALGAQGKWEELTFALPGHCDTVFARFTLADGSQSEVLAAPVISPR